MDWIRRNWPDLLIGLALLLVIGGIIATLLNGGNILPFGRNTTPATVSGSGSDPATPIGPVTNEPAATGDTTTSPTDGGVAPVDLNPQTDTSNSAQTDSVSMPAEQGGDGTIIAVPPTAEGEAVAVAPDAATAAIDEAATDTATVDESAPSEPAVDVAASSAPTAPYRISVGAFGSTENAERRAQAFRDVGYPVFVANQGDLSLVLVGPYNSLAEAEQVKAQMQSSGLEADPIIYEFSSDTASTSETTDTSEAGTPSTTTPTATEPTATTTDAPAVSTSAPATSSSGQYLQVGAYGSLEAAAPLRSRLEGLGFTVSSVEEGSYFKLLVGPYDEAGLATAQGQLTAQGIDHFVR